MSIEVIVLEAPSSERLDQLQQYLWDFEVKYTTSDELLPAQVGIRGSELLLGGLAGQKPIVYGLNQELRFWRDSLTKTLNKSKGKSKGNAKARPAILKALGVGRGDKVIDATFGLGRDSCQLMSAGLKVTAFERVPELFFLAKASQIWEDISEDRLELHFGSVRENPERLPIYFDPMFSDGSDRKAKSGKGMQVFHELVGSDDDAGSEAKRLRELTDRLVIKRAPKAPQLLEGRNSDWTSKAVRFDLYL